MLCTGELVNPNLVRNRDVVRAKGVGGVQRHIGLPVLCVGVCMGDLGAGLGCPATLKLAGAYTRQRIETHVPGLGRLCPWILLFAVLRPRQPGWLREAYVERAAVRGLMRYRSFEHLSTLLVLVKAELDEGANPATALGRAVDDRVLDPIAQRIYQAALVTVAQEGVKVACRGEAKPITMEIGRASCRERVEHGAVG